MTEFPASSDTRSEVVRAEDADEQFIRRKTLTAYNDGGMRTVIDFGEYDAIVTDEPVAHGGTGEGPSPLQTVLGALCGCEAVTFNRTADELGFAYSGITFEGEFTIDIRGRQGDRSVRPHFQTVRVRATVATDEPEDALARIAAETEARCPVFNLISDAGVRLELQWVRRATSRPA